MENRIIKFRGRNKKTGAWVYGSPGFVEYDGISAACILVGFDHNPTTGFTAPDNFFFVEVIPETVGQLTGLLDKNGRDVYEGDILAHLSGRLMPWLITFYDGAFVVQNIMEGRPMHLSDIYPFNQSSAREREIIGNIYEHPELLSTPTTNNR